MPLIGLSAAKNPQEVCKLLEQTMGSILLQPGDVRVLISCNEIPDTRYSADSRVKFLQMDGKVPANVAEMRHDKEAKRKRVIDEVAAEGGGYVVRVDADDLISSRLTRHLLEDDNRVGYVFRQGYTYNVETGEFRLSRSFDRLCGTCGVIYLRPEDLAEGSSAREIAACKHAEFAERCHQLGRPLAQIPFPAALYLTNHGESIQDRLHSHSAVDLVKSRLRSVHSRIRKRIAHNYITADLGAEFGLQKY